MQDLIILIPALNEAKSLRKISKNLRKKNYKFLIANDNSKDRSLIFLKKKKINHLNNRIRLGYEGNLIKSFSYILNNYKNYKYVLTMDGDGEHQISDIKKIYSFIVNKDLDVVIGNRKSKNRFIEIIISVLFNFLYDLKDPLSGFKIYKIQYLKGQIKKTKNNLFLVDLVINIIQSKGKTGFLQIDSKKRKDNSRVGNLFYSNFKMFKILIYVTLKKIFG